METTLKSKNIGQLLAEADELMRRIHADAIEDLQEEHRLLVAKHVRDLKEIKSKVQGRPGKKAKSKKFTGAEGMHEALMDIVRAMQNLKKDLY